MRVLSKQTTDEKELDAIIACLNNSKISDYKIVANIPDATKLAMKVTEKVYNADCYYKPASETNEGLKEVYHSEYERYMNEALKYFQSIVHSYDQANISSVSDNNRYLLKK